MTNHHEAALKALEWTQYRRKQIAQLRPYMEGETLSERVSISAADKEAGSPKLGDMIARNPKNHDDQWLVAADYFAENFEQVEAAPSQPKECCGNYTLPRPSRAGCEGVNMTPYEIEVMLWYYTRGIDHEHYLIRPPAWSPTMQAFLNNGMLEISPPGSGKCLGITDKGCAYVKHLCAVQVPIVQWVQPPKPDRKQS